MYGERYKPPGGGSGETSKPLKWGLVKSAACVFKKSGGAGKLLGGEQAASGKGGGGRGGLKEVSC